MDIINTTYDSRYSIVKSRTPDGVLEQYNIEGISSYNEYLPIIAPKVNLGIYNREVIHYYVPKAWGRLQHIMIKNYKALYNSLEVSTLPIIFKTASMKEDIRVMKGMLFKEVKDGSINILFLVAVKTEYVIEMFDRNNVLDMSKFAIFISKEFYTSKEFKSLHNKMQREIIVPLLDKNVELIITNNIEDRCFKNNISLPKFKAVTEMKKYLSALNNQI